MDWLQQQGAKTLIELDLVNTFNIIFEYAEVSDEIVVSHLDLCLTYFLMSEGEKDGLISRYFQ